MADYSEEVVAAARSRIGAPFRHHFKPEDLCDRGRITLDACMERGMDDSGYDCSGLVLASICDVLGMKVSQWPQKYRHMGQLESLTPSKTPKRGDVLLFYPQSDTINPRVIHMGIFIIENCVIHANGISGIVEEGEVRRVRNEVRVLSSTKLIELVS